MIEHLGETNLLSLAVGAGGILLLVVGGRLFPKRPIVLIVVALSIVLMSITDLAEQGVQILGQVPRGFPTFGLASFSLSDLERLLPLALACFLLSYIESSSAARTFALRNRYAVNPEQELLAIGAANLAVGLGQGYPIAGGMSQSAVNDKGGRVVRWRWSSPRSSSDWCYGS